MLYFPTIHHVSLMFHRYMTLCPHCSCKWCLNGGETLRVWVKRNRYGDNWWVQHVESFVQKIMKKIQTPQKKSRPPEKNPDPWKKIQTPRKKSRPPGIKSRPPGTKSRPPGLIPDYPGFNPDPLEVFQTPWKKTRGSGFVVPLLLSDFSKNWKLFDNFLFITYNSTSPHFSPTP